MGTVTASAGATVPAPPDQVVAFLTDLGARSRILTENYSNVSVQDNNVLAFHFSAGGRERDYRLTSSAQGDTLTERDELSSFVNTWQVTPAGGGSSVTLTAEWDGAGGIGGIFEGLFAPLGLKRIYGEVLTKLAGALGS